MYTDEDPIEPHECLQAGFGVDSTKFITEAMESAIKEASTNGISGGGARKLRGMLEEHQSSGSSWDQNHQLMCVLFRLSLPRMPNRTVLHSSDTNQHKEYSSSMYYVISRRLAQYTRMIRHSWPAQLWQFQNPARTHYASPSTCVERISRHYL